MRPVLRPGVHVLRRSADVLQVGLDPRRAVLLPDRPEVSDLLRDLASPTGAVHDAGSPVLALLVDTGLVLDSGALLPLVPTRSNSVDGAPAPRPAPPDVAALALAAGDQVGSLVATRRSSRVAVHPFGAGDGLAARVTALLVEAGVEAVHDPPAPKRPRALPLAVLIGTGEPPRELLDPWMRSATAHLVVRMTEGTATIGPLVVPGETACLRCVDAHHTDVDPAWPLLLTQYAERTSRARDDGVPEPLDCTLAALTVAWAAREAVSFLEGRDPATRSTTLRLSPHLTTLESQTWPRHTACGCGWA